MLFGNHHFQCFKTNLYIIMTTSNKLTTEVKSAKAKEVKSVDSKEVMPLGKINYILIAACVLLIMLGFYLMTGSANTGSTWNEDVFNSTRTVVGPMVALAGFTLMIFAIIFKKKNCNNHEE